MTTTCKLCYEGENKQYKPGLICKNCVSFVHLDCLWRPGTPGDFAGDIFFNFICGECSKDKKEVFRRDKFPWVNVIYLTLHHLNIHSHGISNHGFFHYKTHVCAFIDRNWDLLFGPTFKQKKNWIGTIAGVLSVYNNVLFQSGLATLSGSGWWRLQHNFSPAVAAHVLQEITRDKPKGGRGKSHMSMDRTLFLEKVIEMGYKDLIVEDRDIAVKPDHEPAPAKKRRVDSDETSAASSNTYFEYFVDDSRPEPVDESSQYTVLSVLTGRDAFSDVETGFRGFDYPQMNIVPPSDSSSMHSHPHFDSDSRSGSPYQHVLEHHSDEYDEKPDIKKIDVKIKKPPAEEKPIITRESLFSRELNSVDMPWLPAKTEDDGKDLVELTEYEEIQLLKQVDNVIPKVKDQNKKAYLRRFRAKLALRRLKRHKHLPIFNFDKAMKILGGYVTEDSTVVTNAERVLDRFQRSYLLDNLSGTVAHTTYGTLLLSHMEPSTFQSPHSGTVLKPFIRRDMESKPLWLNLMDELMRKANRKNEAFVPPPRASIDYSYLRPQHMAAVNNLCAQYFWPGIDLTEALQYPEFSCVVTYKKLVVGCAFLVPDVCHNEAYISFIFTRPEWRRARIATFMLYHLLQTCTGKDVTLHVSPTNPAIFLYQKFGFKVEELIQDFYEKYFDIDYKGCRHALFLRLSR